MREKIKDSDQNNLKILAEREAAFNSHEGPRVGDYVHMLNGTLQRFSHDWGKDIQTTDGRFGSSFYLDKAGYAEFSGGLNPAIMKNTLEQLPETIDGHFWFFSNDEVKAHNGITVNIPCRVFKQIA
jgi:hypothetical protein